MNSKIKTISAAVLAAAMCASFTGCAKEEDNGVYVDKNGNISIDESKFEDHVNSVFGGGDNKSSSAESKPEEVKLAPTDEIKNAALNSGLVQYNNDIFQRGGYITVADFVEKYKDTYDITYMDGSYEERKDYLLEYDEDKDIFGSFFGSQWDNNYYNSRYAGSRYYLGLNPKDAANFRRLSVYVVNATSPDEKITLDKAIVAEIKAFDSLYDNSNSVPKWIPMGLRGTDYKDKYESENNNYTVKDLEEALEANGLKKNAEFDRDYSSPRSSEAENLNTYWKSKIAGDNYSCYVLGEKNLFGAKPLYSYSFYIDSNTDKISYATCYLEYFVEE